MRVYALYLRNKWVLSLVVLEFAAGVVVACVSAALDDPCACISIFFSGLSIECHPM